MVLASHLQDVPETVDSNLPSQVRFVLSHHRQQRCQVIDGVDVVLLYHGSDHFSLSDVSLLSGASLQQLASGLCTFDVSSNYMVVAVALTELAR